MQKVAEYFIQHPNEVLSGNISQDIIFQIGQMNRKHRSELREKLFENAGLLEKNQAELEILKWLRQCFILIDKYSFRFNRVYFSPGNGIRDAIYDLLKNSKSSVYLCVFTITDSKLASEIIHCHQRGLKVKIITDDIKTTAKGSEIFKIEKAGVPIKTDHSKYHMHNKFGIIDGRIALTGSFNWTYTATKHNQENLLTTSNFDIVQQYQSEFKRLWDEMFWF